MPCSKHFLAKSPNIWNRMDYYYLLFHVHELTSIEIQHKAEMFSLANHDSVVKVSQNPSTEQTSEVSRLSSRLG